MKRNHIAKFYNAIPMPITVIRPAESYGHSFFPLDKVQLKVL